MDGDFFGYANYYNGESQLVSILFKINILFETVNFGKRRNNNGRNSNQR